MLTVLEKCERYCVQGGEAYYRPQSLNPTLEAGGTWRLTWPTQSALHLGTEVAFPVSSDARSRSVVWRRKGLINNSLLQMTGSPGQARPLTWINMTSSWEKICKLILFQIPVGIWWHWVTRGHYLLVLGETGPVLGGTDWYLIVLGWWRAVPVVTWWYWVSIGWYWSVLGDTGSNQGGTGCQCDMLSENIWFTWSKPSNHWILGQ